MKKKVMSKKVAPKRPMKKAKSKSDGDNEYVYETEEEDEDNEDEDNHPARKPSGISGLLKKSKKGEKKPKVKPMKFKKGK
jgi:hypothetical protein